MATGPKTFISYAWTSPTHQNWVLDLANQLRENGVDVTIDKWDLREGHDAIAFMEKMVTDPEIKKVIIVLNRTYAEKADGRQGGVGTETQIISPEIYAKEDQNKFCGVASEVGEDGKPFTPAFYRSRIYINLSQGDIYATNFEQLVRWVYDKPAHPKPALGKRPEYLDDHAIQLPTRSRALRAIDQIKSGSPQATIALDDYLTMLGDSFEELRIARDKNDANTFDDAVVQSVGAFLPYRDEFITVISTLARYTSIDDDTLIRRFFEKVIPFTQRPKSENSWQEWDFDNFKFIVHELFLYTVAIFLKYERFGAVYRLMSQGYYVGDAMDDNRQTMRPYNVMRGYMSSLKHRNQRLKLNRLSVLADMLKERAHASGIPWHGLMQADFVLWFYDALTSHREERDPRWWPETLVFYAEYAPPFEIFARAESQDYFKKIMPLIAVSTKPELVESFKLFGTQNAPIHLPTWDYFHTFSLANATNIEKL